MKKTVCFMHTVLVKYKYKKEEYKTKLYYRIQQSMIH